MYLNNTAYFKWGQTVSLMRKILKFSAAEGVKNQSSSWAENASKLEDISQTEMLREDPTINNLLFRGKLPTVQIIPGRYLNPLALNGSIDSIQMSTHDSCDLMCSQESESLIFLYRTRRAPVLHRSCITSSEVMMTQDLWEIHSLLDQELEPKRDTVGHLGWLLKSVIRGMSKDLNLYY